MRRLLPLLASLVLLALPTAAHGYTFYEWSFPGGPAGIAPAGTAPLWASRSPPRGASAQVDPTGRRHVRRRKPVTGAATAPTALALGPGDNNLWFVDTVNGRVGRTDTGAGAITLAHRHRRRADGPRRVGRPT